jgi:hypothetical protein
MTVNGTPVTTGLAVHKDGGITVTEQEWHRHSDTAAAGTSMYGARSRGSE